VAQTPTVEFAYKFHIFFKKSGCKDTKNNRTALLKQKK